jgi:mRNA interferase MazF
MTRGEIYYADLSPCIGSEQGGHRPVLIIQNNVGNEHSSTVIIASITSSRKPYLPTHVGIKAKATGLPKDSTVLCEQIRTVDKQRLYSHCGYVDKNTMAQKIDKALLISLNLTGERTRDHGG